MTQATIPRLRSIFHRATPRWRRSRRASLAQGGDEINHFRYAGQTVPAAVDAAGQLVGPYAAREQVRAVDQDRGRSPEAGGGSGLHRDEIDRYVGPPDLIEGRAQPGTRFAPARAARKVQQRSLHASIMRPA